MITIKTFWFWFWDFLVIIVEQDVIDNKLYSILGERTAEDDKKPMKKKKEKPVKIEVRSSISRKTMHNPLYLLFQFCYVIIVAGTKELCSFFRHSNWRRDKSLLYISSTRGELEGNMNGIQLIFGLYTFNAYWCLKRYIFFCCINHKYGPT